MKFFVSYTTRDNEVTKETLLSISNKFRQIGDVFIDLIDNNSKDVQFRIMKELDSSNHLILVETSQTYLSEWVLIELNRANEKNIPISKFPLKKLKKITAKDLQDLFS